MPRPRFTSLVLPVVTGLLALIPSAALPAQPEVHPDEVAMKAEIDAAIEKGVDYLFEEQHRDGSWGLHGDYVGGRAGLALYTLLQCGVARDHPSVRRAVAYLDAVEPTKVYATTCMILALDALRDGREERIAALVQQLLDWQRPQGDWAYPHGAADLSNTQYAALGMWIGYKRGLEIDPSHWLKLADALERYREPVQKIDDPEPGAGTGVTKVDMAGYRYRGGANNATTGSMTSAGLAIIAICKAGLGRRLTRQVQATLDDHQQAAVRWLARNFDADRNPNGGHYHYYMYGLERVGTLLQTERFGAHWWYVEGARQLLAKQKNGSWGNVTDTCFALLFLRRATSGSAATTGLGSGERHLFAVGGPDDDVRLRGAGQQPLSLWIDGFGASLAELHEQYGLRVVSVAYVDAQGNVLGKVAGDPTKVWQSDAYLHREKAMARGEHEVRARITLVANDVEPPKAEPVEVVESGWMAVRIRDVFEPWMAETNATFAQNLLLAEDVEVVATSHLDERNGGKNLVDGRDSTRWIASPDDQQPGVTLSWRRPIRVGSILFALPAQHARQLGEFDAVGGIEVRLGNDRDRWIRIPVGDDPLVPVEFALPKARRLRSIEVRFFDRVRRNGRVGLSELVLLQPDR